MQEAGMDFPQHQNSVFKAADLTLKLSQNKLKIPNEHERRRLETIAATFKKGAERLEESKIKEPPKDSPFSSSEVLKSKGYPIQFLTGGIGFSFEGYTSTPQVYKSISKSTINSFLQTLGFLMPDEDLESHIAIMTEEKPSSSDVKGLKINPLRGELEVTYEDKTKTIILKSNFTSGLVLEFHQNENGEFYNPTLRVGHLEDRKSVFTSAHGRFVKNDDGKEEIQWDSHSDKEEKLGEASRRHIEVRDVLTPSN